MENGAACGARCGSTGRSLRIGALSEVFHVSANASGRARPMLRVHLIRRRPRTGLWLTVDDAQARRLQRERLQFRLFARTSACARAASGDAKAERGNGAPDFSI